MDAKRKVAEDKRRKEKEEEMKLEKRLKEQQEKMKREFEEEMNRKKAKEEAVSIYHHQETALHSNLLLFISETKTAGRDAQKANRARKRSRTEEKRVE